MAKKTKRSKPLKMEQARKRIRNVMEAARKRGQKLIAQAGEAADQVAKTKLIDRAHDVLLAAADKIAGMRKQMGKLGGPKREKKRAAAKKRRPKPSAAS